MEGLSLHGMCCSIHHGHLTEILDLLVWRIVLEEAPRDHSDGSFSSLAKYYEL